MATSQIYAGFMSTDSKYEVQRTNNFRLILDLSDEGDTDGYLELACETSGLPSYTVEATESAYGNSSVKVAGKPSFEDISVTVKDFIEPDLEQVLMNWMYKVYNPKNGKIGWATYYKKQARINLYAPNGTVTRTWVADGVWPTGIELGDLDYTGSDLRKLTMTLSVDNAYIDRDNTTNSGDYTTND